MHGQKYMTEIILMKFVVYLVFLIILSFLLVIKYFLLQMETLNTNDIFIRKCYYIFSSIKFLDDKGMMHVD